ncbi:MAG TPA: ABC transporter permease [Candidatus Sulfotelmatobacter sp.]|nr:ABC transporter permease [Candidatus Sulfotelmatobacter sp.]
MRNTWLIIKREYLQRVRTRSFLVLTLLLPAIMTVLMVLPAKLATVGVKAQHIVIVTSNAQFGETVRQQLLSTPVTEDDEDSSSDQAKAKPQDQYVIDVDTNATDAERTALREKVSNRTIDGFLWLPEDFLTTRKVDWNSRELIGSRERVWLSAGVNHIALQQQLSKAGLTSAQTDPILTPIKVDPVRIEGGKEAKGSGTGRFLEIFVMVMLLYMAVLFYGISVMRSVLEEKNSRIMEVLLSSATSTELMTGKLLGVGAVGLTQILVWTIMAGVIALPSMAMQPNLSELQISPIVLLSFAAFFLLGYLLYSTMYAAIGAITTTEQEGQQIQFLIVIPLVLSVFMLMPVIRTPDSAAVVWLSLVPFFAPILMYARIVVQTPPLWQIAVCLVLMVATVAGLTVLCARIYRIGVLIYGKRATLPEIMKWLKYAKT